MAKKPAGRSTGKPRNFRSAGYLIKVLSQLHYRRAQFLLQPFDLTPFHWLVLRCLSEEDGLPVSEITQRLQEVGGTMTGVIDRMEERELVSRVRDASDRRIYRVYLTKKGQEVERQLRPLAERSRKRLYKGISPKNLALFESLCEQMITNCQESLQEGES